LKYLIVFLMIFFIGCGTSSDNSHIEPEPEKPIDLNITWVVASQDTFDSDNFSFITTLANLHKLKYIKLLAVDVTGYDTGLKGGLIFNTLLEEVGVDIPVIVNQRSPRTRITPSSQIYNFSFPNDGVYDPDRRDSTNVLIEILENLPEGKKIVYVVGGHLHNLADLLKENRELSKKIQAVILSIGWTDRTSSKAEMNLSEGLYHPSGTSEATQYVFANLPQEVELIIATDPYSRPRRIPYSFMEYPALKYFVENGHYTNHKDIGLGDFEAAVWGINDGLWYDVRLGEKVKTCFKINSYGAASISTCDKNHWYIKNFNTVMEEDIFKMLLKKHSIN